MELSRVFQRKDVPFLLTVLLSLLAWSLSRVVDRTTAAPTVTYECARDAQNAGTTRCALTNVSQEKVFRGLRLYVTRTAPQISAPRLDWHAPCIDSLNREEPTKSDETGKSYDVTIARLDPGCQVDLVTQAAPDSQIDLRITSSDSAAVRFEPASCATWVAQHERGTLLVLIAFWSLLILAYGFFWARSGGTTP